MDSFGNKFRIALFGESHGEALGVVIDGMRPGIALSESDFAADIDRRRAGAPGTTARHESDQPEIVSGIYNGFTTGTPVALIFRNMDARPGDYDKSARHPRPSHADWTAHVKYGGYNDPRGGGHFSGRLTLPLVAAGVAAKKMLGGGVSICARLIRVGGETDAALFDEIIEIAKNQGDSVGGVIECTVEGFPAGRGEPFFDSVESVLSHLLFSIPGVRGVEFGAGFAAAAMRGSLHNDPIVSADGKTLTNNAGGINGGIANGNPIVFRVAVKPTPSIARPQNTLDLDTGTVEPLVIGGRHDVCIALRMPVVVEAAAAIALAQF